uniref:SHSP domain-containing protein n=1 Tax=Arundo donax TaxID=35708 RepID=A0A0A9EUD2_ARUDO
MELDRWRSRLPEGSCPAMAVAGYVDGQLVVTVPKGRDGGEGSDGEGEVTWRCCNGGKISEDWLLYSRSSGATLFAR